MLKLSQDSEDRNLQDFHYDVSLHVSHPDFDPVQVSTELGFQPARRPTRYGEPKTTPKGLPLEGHWAFSLWAHDFETIQDGDLVSSLECIVATLEPHRHFLQRIVDEGGEIELFVGVFTDTNCDQELPYDLLGRLAELRVNLRLDIYGSKLRQVEHPPIAAPASKPSAGAI